MGVDLSKLDRILDKVAILDARIDNVSMRRADAEFSESDHPRNDYGRFSSVGLHPPQKSAPEDFHKVFRAAYSAAEKIEASGLKLTRANMSAISPSTYLTFTKPDQNDFKISKKGRGIYVREHGSFPSMGNFNVRVSNHRSYGGGTDVHKSIRVEKGAPDIASAEKAAQKLLELESTYPSSGL